MPPETPSTPTYLVAASKSWNRQLFDEQLRHYPGNWQFIDRKEDLSVERLQQLQPRQIFFLHWSWKVPAEIIERFECVCFHMTDVPYGRGGSPLQNLIVRGHKATRLTALRMVEAFDAGPVYLKAELDLSGSAEEIFRRASTLATRMIRTLIEEQPVPQPQRGEVVNFARRKPEQSRIPEVATPEQVYDHIRMLDAEGYPPAFIEHQGRRYEFSRATLEGGKIVASVTITPCEEEIP